MRRTLITAVVALAAIGALGGTAQASLIDTDDVMFTSSGYDLGSVTWYGSAGVPGGPGSIDFHHENGKIRPQLNATLHLNNAEGTCGRVRLDYYDGGGQLLATKYRGELCVDDDDHHTRYLTADPYVDESIESVRVSVERETAASGWSSLWSETYDVGTHADEVKITEDGVDLGDHDFAFGEPITAAHVGWTLDDGDVAPYLIGYVHINNELGECARVNLRFLTEAGTFLTESASSAFCAPDNDHHRFGVILQPYSSNKIGKLRVQLQTQGSDGSWNTAGSETVSIEE